MIFISFIHCSFIGYDRTGMGEIFHLEHWKEPYILGTREVLKQKDIFMPNNPSPQQ